MKVILVSFLMCLSSLAAVQAEVKPDATVELGTLIATALKVQNQKVPSELLKKQGTLEKGPYDPNAFLAAFPRLSLETGMTLDFVYDYQGTGGHPIVYARGKDQVPFSSLAEYKKKFPRPYFLGDSARYNPSYLEAIKTDGTSDGFLQLALHVLLAEQFYIHWHAVYSVNWPVFDQQMVEDIKASLPVQVQKQVDALVLKPEATLNQDEARVTYVYFNSWKGFVRVTWRVDRAFPHRFRGVDEHILIAYRNPVRF